MWVGFHWRHLRQVRIMPWRLMARQRRLIWRTRRGRDGCSGQVRNPSWDAFDVMTQLVEEGRNLTSLFVIRPHLHPQNPR